MGLQKQYLKVGQSAKNRLFGIQPNTPVRKSTSGRSRNADTRPLQMMVSDQNKISNSRLAVIVLGLLTLAIGVVLSSIPWLDYIILKNLRLWNGTLSYHYWQKPGVLRLTKVFIFNVTNPDGFMHNGEKPRLEEVGPFVYREDMQKVNIQFHDNGTVTFQHYKILEFMPEMSVAPNNTRFILPNIPLLTLTSQANALKPLMKTGVSLALRMTSMKPFVSITAEELVFGYDDTLTSLANRFFPKGKRPPRKMGLFLGRNGTISDVQTIYTGHGGMENFGYMDKLNGLDHLPYWDESPCNAIRASEGSFFPPREMTKSDIVHVYDKDLCRIWPLRYRRDVEKDGLKAGYYTPDDEIFTPGETNAENKCYCPGQEKCPPQGLQNIAPCQFDAPVFLSFPHFYKADPELLEAVEGLEPKQEKHETFFKIQPKLGVPLEAAVRVQLNLAVEESTIHAVRGFPTITFPIMWVEEGIGDLPPNIHRWIYLATSFAPNLAPILEYGFIIFGSLVLIVVFVRAYKSLVFTQENLERGREKLRRGSSFIVNGQHRLMIIRDSYSLLGNHSPESEEHGTSD